MKAPHYYSITDEVAKLRLRFKNMDEIPENVRRNLPFTKCEGSASFQVKLEDHWDDIQKKLSAAKRKASTTLNAIETLKSGSHDRADVIALCKTLSHDVQGWWWAILVSLYCHASAMSFNTS
jgi:hypothetical protein